MGDEAQRGLQLLPSKTDPRQKRWQRPGGAQGASGKKTGADTRASFVAKHRAKRASEKKRLEFIAQSMPNQRDADGSEVTPAQIAAAKARLKAIGKEEAGERRQAARKQAVVNKRAAAMQTSVFDTPEERKHGKKKQRSMFADEAIDDPKAFAERERKKPAPAQGGLFGAPKKPQAQPDLFGAPKKPAPAQGGLFKSLRDYDGPLLLVPTSG